MKISLSLKSILQWLDEYALLVLGTFLLFFIPLYPKIPLFSPIEQYIVRVRWEDVLVFLTAVIWLVQVVRKKITWKLPVSPIIFAYAVVGALSLLTAMFVIKTIPLQPLHVGKSLLHYFRYMEYFSLFFILGSSIKTKAHLKLVLVVSIVTLFLVGIYGIGQKYYYWPVYSTMNREFSKGVRLYLTPHARVQSTFAGHYDLAAYLVILLPFVLGSFFIFKNKWVKLCSAAGFTLGLWLLVVSASRTSFPSAIGGISLVVLVLAWFQKGWLKKITWGASRLFVVYAVLGLLLFQFGTDIYDRFLQVIDSNPQWHDTYHYYNGLRKDYTTEVIAFVTGKSKDEARQPIVKTPTPPPGAQAVDENGALVASDERPVATRPSDVYVDVPDYVQVSTVSATGETITTTVAKDRVFSDCANQNGLSWCIRWETLWPKAIDGFMQDPLFGKGYATLNKDSVDQFTEAESTDNNFLRTLGETGLAGFITFYGVIVVAVIYLLKHYRRSDQFEKVVIVAYIAATLGLLGNAALIDVFAASKVAFVYWSLTGTLVGYFYFSQPTLTEVVATKKVTKTKSKKR